LRLGERKRTVVSFLSKRKNLNINPMKLIEKLLSLLGLKSKIPTQTVMISHPPKIVRVKSPRKVLVEVPSGKALSWKVLRRNGEQLTIRRTGHPRCPALTVDFRPSIGDELRLEGLMKSN